MLVRAAYRDSQRLQCHMMYRYPAAHSQVDGPVVGLVNLAKVGALPLVLFTLSHLWTTQRSPAVVGRGNEQGV